jgi:hypothetical protein
VPRRVVSRAFDAAARRNRRARQISGRPDFKPLSAVAKRRVRALLLLFRARDPDGNVFELLETRSED